MTHAKAEKGAESNQEAGSCKDYKDQEYRQGQG